MKEKKNSWHNLKLYTTIFWSVWGKTMTNFSEYSRCPDWGSKYLPQGYKLEPICSVSQNEDWTGADQRIRETCFLLMSPFYQECIPSAYQCFSTIIKRRRVWMLTGFLWLQSENSILPWSVNVCFVALVEHENTNKPYVIAAKPFHNNLLKFKLFAK
jgi:hypothetical protein